MKNHYETLGVKQDATQDDIRLAFRKLAMQYHPDKNPGNKEAEDIFKSVNEANAILSDENKRKKYDMELAYGPSTGYTNIADHIRDFVRNQQAYHEERSKRGNDISSPVFCSFEETINGLKTSVQIETNNICSHCKGEPIKSNARKNPCTRCNGKGFTVFVQDMGNRTMHIQQQCSNCGGGGTIYNASDCCQYCSTTGLINETVTVDIVIPAGSAYGESILVSHKGLYITPKGNRGNCYVKITPKEHEIFKADQSFNIGLEIYLTPVEAMLGTTLDIPTIDGISVKLDIPPGTNAGQSFVIDGKGLVNRSKRRSDMVVFVKIEVPDGTNAMREAVEALRQYENADSLPRTYEVRQKLSKYIKKE